MNKPFTPQFFDKVDAAAAKGSPIILSWEFAWGLRNELEAVAAWIAKGCPQVVSEDKQ